MKSFSERNPLVVGAIGVVAVAGIVLAALQYQKLPFLNQGKNCSAYFADAGGLKDGAAVEVSGYPVGKVSSIELDGPGVLVKFKVGGNVRLGDRTEAAIKSKGLLGSKILDVTPRGDGPAQRCHPDRQDDVALPAARCTWRLVQHHQRAEHRPAVQLAGHAGANLCRYPAGSEECGARGGAVCANPQRSRRATPQPARQCQPKRPACWPSALTKWSAWLGTPTRCWRNCGRKAPPWMRYGPISPRCRGN